MNHSRTSELILPLLGAIPFIACPLLLFFNINALPLLGSTLTILMSYSLTIVTFMTGIFWGMSLSKTEKTHPRLFLISNILFLFIWFSYLLLSPPLFLCSVITSLIAVYFIDSFLYQRGHLQKTYLLVRGIVTGLVVLSLIWSIILLLGA